ncbi:hypothetical protein CEW46_30440 [Bacillus cereus]|nr:hypothetical protein CEW46_30440 [Bacillus cereus]
MKLSDNIIDLLENSIGFVKIHEERSTTNNRQYINSPIISREDLEKYYSGVQKTKVEEWSYESNHMFCRLIISFDNDGPWKCEVYYAPSRKPLAHETFKAELLEDKLTQIGFNTSEYRGS